MADDADAVAAATEENMQQIQAQSAALDKFAPEILKSFLEGASWADAFDEFFAANCPLFAEFVVGEEYSLVQSDVHLRFVATAESLLDQQLGQMAMSADAFLAQTMSDLKTAPPDSPAGMAAAAVMERLEECADFERFGAMMRARHDLLQAGDDEEEEEDEEDEDAEFAREQREIREASERRRRAREEAVRRADEAARELDAPESEPEPEPEVEPSLPDARAAAEARAEAAASGMQFPAVSEVATVDISAVGSELLELEKLQNEEWQTVGADGKATGDFWEVGTVETGVVSFWNMGAGWGKIKKLGGGQKLHPKRPPRKGWKREIFVHNTQLPMDARRRWLRRGESVQFKVGVGAKGKGPQAMGVVGLGPDGEEVQLLCQQQDNPPAFKRGFLDGKSKRKKKGRGGKGGGLIGGKKRAD